MNAFGGICWVLLMGGGAYLFGEEMKRVAGRVELLLVIVATGGLAVGGIIFFRYHRRNWSSARSVPFPGRIDAPASAAMSLTEGHSSLTEELSR